MSSRWSSTATATLPAAHTVHRGAKRPRTSETGSQICAPVQFSLSSRPASVPASSKDMLRIPQPRSRAEEPEAKRSCPAGRAPVIGPQLPPSSAVSPAAASSKGTKRANPEPSASKKCDKCDGPHETDRCPHFKKPREGHKDAWVNYGQRRPKQLGESGGRFVLRSGRPVRQPGDGSCLFHSLCFGLNHNRPCDYRAAKELRRELATFIGRNPHLEISGDTLAEWIRWDARCSVDAYARRMAVGGWGGGIEMAACSLLKRVNVHVYESKRNGEYERISCFDCPVKTSRTIHVLYKGGMHYDALVVPGS